MGSATTSRMLIIGSNPGARTAVYCIAFIGFTWTVSLRQLVKMEFLSMGRWSKKGIFPDCPSYPFLHEPPKV
jgi:hypothetical protein